VNGIQEIIRNERQLEAIKMKLVCDQDFNLTDAWSMLDYKN